MPREVRKKKTLGADGYFRQVKPMEDSKFIIFKLAAVLIIENYYITL